MWGDSWLEEERDQFSTNLNAALASGRMHYVVVAQRFTPTMERTADYLNSVAAGARFYLVELIRFSNGEMDAFEARTVLKPQPHRTGGGASSTKLTASTFLSSETDPEPARAAREFLDFCTGQGLSVFWGTTGISIRMPTADGGQPLSIAWAYPDWRGGSMGLSGLAIGYDLVTAEQHPSATSDLDEVRRRPAVASSREPGEGQEPVDAVFAVDAEAANMVAIEERLGELVSGSTTAD